MGCFRADHLETPHILAEGPFCQRAKELAWQLCVKWCSLYSDPGVLE